MTQELVVNMWTGRRKIHRATCRTLTGKQLGARSLPYMAREQAERIINELGFGSWSCKVCKPLA